MLYTMVMFGGVIPVSHWFVSHDGFNHPLVQVGSNQAHTHTLSCFASAVDFAKDSCDVCHHHHWRNFLPVKISREIFPRYTYYVVL